MLTETLPQEHAKFAGFVDFLPASEAITSAQAKQVYEQNKHQIYSLAFWMTDNELEAEELSANTFRRAFRTAARPSAEMLDRALIAELRESQLLGTLVLHCPQADQVLDVRARAKRVHLERAVVQLPATERLIFLLHDVLRRYPAGIGRLLGLTEHEVRNGLHQARLRMRELLASMS